MSQAGDAAYAYAEQQVHKPYIWGGVGPTGYDCSGLMWASYKYGAGGVDIGRIVWDQVATARAGRAGGTMLWDVTNPNRGDPKAVQLQTGDVFSYGQPGDFGTSRGHTRMVAPTGMVAAEDTAIGIVNLPTVQYDSGPSDPLYGIARYGGGAPGGGGGAQGSGGTGSSSGGNNNQDTIGYADKVQASSYGANGGDLPDPRDNRPFSPYFMGWAFNGTEGLGWGPIVSGAPRWDVNYSAGGRISPVQYLIRGGMSEAFYNGTPRPRGQFKVFFMLNPESISSTVDLNSDIAAPQTLSQDTQGLSYVLSNQSITFQLVFNRMYEVWKGDLHGPSGQPGPSDVGVIWDIRAIERLMGMYDATQAMGGFVGNGVYGAAFPPPAAMPIQVVFGGSNSIQFQGRIASLDYTYTRFSKDMIPVECTVDVGVMRQYMPTESSQDLVNSLVQTVNSKGTPQFPQATGGWNTPDIAPAALPPVGVKP